MKTGSQASNIQSRSKIYQFVIAIILLSSEATLALPFDCSALLTSASHRISRFFKPVNLEQMRIEKGSAKNAFETATKLIQTANNYTETDRLIALVSDEQRQYCDAHNRIVSVTGGYSIVPLDAHYIGENYAKSYYNRKLERSAPILSGIPIYYFSELERQSAHILFRDGKAFYGDGTQLKNIFGLEYVMDEDGEVYIMLHFSNALRGDHMLRHGSLINGRPVAAAGTITFNSNGSIERITRSSGHY